LKILEKLRRDYVLYRARLESLTTIVKPKKVLGRTSEIFKGRVERVRNRENSCYKNYRAKRYKF